MRRLKNKGDKENYEENVRVNQLDSAFIRTEKTAREMSGSRTRRAVYYAINSTIHHRMLFTATAFYYHRVLCRARKR